MMWARWARPSATVANCSISSTPVPASVTVWITGMQQADHDRRQAEGEFVDQQVAGLADQRLGQHHHLLLAAGKGPGGRRQPPRELREQLETRSRPDWACSRVSA